MLNLDLDSNVWKKSLCDNANFKSYTTVMRCGAVVHCLEHYAKPKGIGKVYTGRVFTASEIHWFSSHKADSARIK